ncbi:MAG: MFS transporter [Firmicutes bacterium]|nr:MFS transporter [Bacillota bacterium]
MKRKDIWLYYAVVLIYWFSTSTYLPVMTPYLKEIGIDYAMIGLIGGAYGFMQMLVRLPLGILSDRINKRKIFVIMGVALSAISSLGLYIGENEVYILFFRGVTGAAAASWVIMTVLFSGYFEREKTAEKISMLTTMNNLGQFLAMILGGTAAGYFGYKATFLLGGAAGIVGTVMSFCIKEDIREREEKISVKQLLEVMKDKKLINSGILCLMVQFIAFGATNTFTSEKAVNIGGDAVQLGMISVVMTIPRVLSAAVCSYLFAKKVKCRYIVFASFAVTAVSCIVSALAENMAMIYTGSVLGGAGTGMGYAALIATCSENIEREKRSTAMGAFQAIFGIGTFLGPIVIGGIAQNMGIGNGFYFAAVTAAVTAVCTLFMI